MITAAGIAALIGTVRFQASDEYGLQAGLADLFTRHGIGFDREVRLDRRDRIDFLLADGIGVECKVDGSPSDVVRQLSRYSQHGRIHGLVLVTTRARLGAGLPDSIGGKVLVIASTWRSGL